MIGKTTKWWTLALAGALLIQVGCGTDEGDTGSPDTAVEDPALVDIDVLLDGAPDNSQLQDEDKADQNFPATFTELVELQSPVKSQGSRGVCSIFSTAAYMEHLYIAEGTIPDLDVSEQYLQWSAKFEVGSFPNTSGSNANSNLDAISRFGVPEEEAWPYETQEWNSSNDEACTGDDMPTRCYTNGEPPAEALEADKYFLPRGRWMSSRPRSIKAQMFNKKQGVVVGLTFFYQAWNHRRSELPTNREYWRKGYVLHPNADDERISLEKRAGHSILLVGWDDTLEIPKVDSAGEVITDADGEPIMDRGFFLFKNSWGTGSFGSENPHGDGYGWISMQYVEEYGSVRISDLPELETIAEVCGDGIDNDDNGATDCDDAACAGEAICEESSLIIDFGASETAIPDNDADGVTLPVEVTDTGTIDTLTLSVNIEHTYRGDLSIDLISPDGTEVRVHEPNYETEDNLERTFVVEDFSGAELAGEWQLVVADHARVDTGQVLSATMEVVLQ